ncbi:bifunctional metallophosphatase/5'-nucleotidase [Oceanobacillus saliphilus]|uniref:bifunctional metallophosphatase/5'-nucleotidase n=1 Tax=Oceanobacillus saliphilus TaxID=2925834 RepID=UPI00201D3985|nr:5'-nucleotidase C-terminal domain-containing protein [Oceanobacillus saliphilus]
MRSKGKRSKALGALLSVTLGVNLLLPVAPVTVNAAANLSEVEASAELFEYNLQNYKTGKLMVHDPRVSITLDATSHIKNGIVFTGDYAEFYGDGFEDTSVTIKPKNDGTVVDFKGTELSKVIIEGNKVREIRGSENVEEMDFVKGANPDTIDFPEETNFELSIMHTNDTHANLDNVAKLVTAVNEVRDEKPHALLLDAGDVMSGTLYFNEFNGMADLQFMNLMGYDAMTFGNHEFDLGSSAEGLQALVDFIEAAQFPFVSSNVDFSGDEKFTGLFNDLISSEPENGQIYNGIIKEIEGEEVGIFGLTTAETADLASPGDVTFDDYIESAEKVVAAFENQGVDKIIAVTHIGFDDNPAVDNDLTLAAEVDGIDVIVGGHSHTQLDEPVVVDTDENGRVKDPTIIVQAYQYNNFLGTLDVEFDQNGVVVGFAGELISIADKEADPVAAEMLLEYSSVIEEVSQQEIGAIAETALLNPRLSDHGNDGTSVRNSETPLGNLITDGMLAKAKQFNNEVIMSMQNGGGIRAGIDEGPITVGEVITVLPFGNTLATVELSGAELKEVFEISLRNYPGESGGFLHVSGGKVEFDSSKPAGERVVSISYENEDGDYTVIEDEAFYTITTNAFTAKGGDGFTVFVDAYGEGRVTDLGLSDWENFAEHLTNLGNVSGKVEGRILDIATQQ